MTDRATERAAHPCPLPPDALLARYAPRAYTDSYAVEVPGTVNLAAFIEAFYTSRVFKLELWIVGRLFRRPSSGAEARRLAHGQTDAFSAWRVEDRTADQLLMREVISGKTRSWLKVQPDGEATRLYFGSAVLPVGAGPDGRPRMSRLFALVGFHRVYSRVLLASARARLDRTH